MRLWMRWRSEVTDGWRTGGSIRLLGEPGLNGFGLGMWEYTASGLGLGRKTRGLCWQS